MGTFINRDKLFLDEQTFKDMIPSSRNVTDTQTIYYAIALSQNQNIKSILGYDFYQDIVDKYAAYVDSGTTLSTADNVLINDYIKPIIAFSTYKRLINNLTFKLKEGGLRSSVDTNSAIAEYQDRATIIGEITNDINGFIQDMKHYIYENRSEFQLYKGDLSHDADDSKDIELMIGKVEKQTDNPYAYGNKYNKSR